MSRCPAERQGLQHCMRHCPAEWQELPCGMARAPRNNTGARRCLRRRRRWWWGLLPLMRRWRVNRRRRWWRQPLRHWWGAAVLVRSAAVVAPALACSAAAAGNVFCGGGAGRLPWTEPRAALADEGELNASTARRCLRHVPARRQGMVNEDFPFVCGVPLRCGKGASITGASRTGRQDALTPKR